jgi:hypothetical protein
MKVNQSGDCVVVMSFQSYHPMIIDTSGYCVTDAKENSHLERMPRFIKSLFSTKFHQ